MGKGADWVKSAYKTELSDLGNEVAELLNEWAFGIYHIEDSLKGVSWTNTYVISIKYFGDISTTDFDQLTRLVFMAHWYCIRITIKPCNMQYIRILFHKRKRIGSYTLRHPTLDEAVESFKALMEKHETKEYEDTKIEREE